MRHHHFTLAFKALILQSIHDGSALIAKSAARVVSMQDPRMRFLILKAGKKYVRSADRMNNAQ